MQHGRRTCWRTLKQKAQSDAHSNNTVRCSQKRNIQINLCVVKSVRRWEFAHFRSRFRTNQFNFVHLLTTRVSSYPIDRRYCEIQLQISIIESFHDKNTENVGIKRFFEVVHFECRRKYRWWTNSFIMCWIRSIDRFQSATKQQTISFPAFSIR